jgi:hypothetical protein
MYKSKIDKNRERKTERDRGRDRWHKAQGIVPHLFSLKWSSLENARSQLAMFYLSKH